MFKTFKIQVQIKSRKINKNSFLMTKIAQFSINSSTSGPDPKFMKHFTVRIQNQQNPSQSGSSPIQCSSLLHCTRNARWHKTAVYFQASAPCVTSPHSQLRCELATFLRTANPPACVCRSCPRWWSRNFPPWTFRRLPLRSPLDRLRCNCLSKDVVYDETKEIV